MFPRILVKTAQDQRYSPNFGKVRIILSVGRECVVESGATSKGTALAIPAFPVKQVFGGQEALVVGTGLEVAVAVITAILHGA